MEGESPQGREDAGDERKRRGRRAGETRGERWEGTETKVMQA